MSEAQSPLIQLAALSMIVFGLAGVSVMTGIIPGAFSAKPVAEDAAKACGDCGVVESIKQVEAKGEVTGVVIGKQIGAGRGKTVIAAGGAYADEIEEDMKSAFFRVAARMNDGNILIVTQENEPGFNPGDPVKLVNNNLVRD